MKISGFTIIKNAINLGFPVVEAIRSVLDLVDEFVVRVGESDDDTEALIRSIESPKIRIVKCNWDTSTYKTNGMIYARETDLALRECTGDWCVYIQADEVLHEDAIPVIREACANYLNDSRVEGFLLKYYHFWGDYNHYIDARHFAYPREIRIVRNLKTIHSWRDAQSFRIIPDFDEKDYYQKEGTTKLKCVLLDAYMYHYGWARDPRCMVKKRIAQDAFYSGNEAETQKEEYFDYGNMSCMPLFKRTHPKAMNERIAAMDWNHLLRYDGAPTDMRKKFKLKYRIINFIENTFLPEGSRIGGFRNYTLVK
jgi:glycosyltransferase involved in cell wall biosynthesis